MLIMVMTDCKNYIVELQFKEQRIWASVMEDLMSKGMRFVDQVIETHMHEYI